MKRNVAIRPPRLGFVLVLKDTTPHRIPWDEVDALRRRGLSWRIVADHVGRKGGNAFRPESIAQGYRVWLKEQGRAQA